MDASDRPPLSPGLKFALEVGPLLLLIAVTVRRDLVTAAIPFAATSLVATAILYHKQRKLNAMLLFSTAAVAVFAALTWWRNDSTFLKLKITMVSALIGAVLLLGTALGKTPLRALLDGALPIDAVGWRKLGWRLGVFFIAMAGLNEIVRRALDDNGYVIAKLVLFLPLPILFLLTQMPLIKRHSTASDQRQP